MNRALFVSDIHIQSNRDANCALFAQFLGHCLQTKPDVVFLVGDIFDLWIADRDYFVSAYAELIERVRALRDAGVEVYYFEGNHDLDLRVFWHDLVGVKVFEGPAYFDLLGKTVRVEHGDQMDPGDKGYLFLRWLLRTPAMRGLGRHMPDPLVKWVGENASHASRDYTSKVKTISDGAVEAKLRRHLEVAHAEKPFDLLVTGHVHVAMDFTVDIGGRPVRAFNLGTWLKQPLVLEMTPGHERLMPANAFSHHSGDGPRQGK